MNISRFSEMREPPHHCLVSRFGCLALLLAASATLEAAHNELGGLSSARQSITSHELRDHVALLADDSLEGREAGSRGGYAAGNYLIQQLQTSLQPAGTDGYFQLFAPRYRNILAILPGTDPTLRDEYILIGAHYDHVGYGTRRDSRGPIGAVHNGADDNASGTAALLEVIQAMTQHQTQLRRSVLFAFWDGEEKGLLGSQHWNREPTIPINRVRLAINLDMVGHLDDRPLEVIGTRSTPGLRWMMTQANHRNELRLTFPWEVEENSDHHSFFSRNMPILMFHTGLHDDYHRPTDDAETLDIDGLTRTSRFTFNALVVLANSDQLGNFRLAARHENEQSQREYERPLPLPNTRHGMHFPAGNETDGRPGLLVRSVTHTGAAQRAGIRAGDRLLALNETSLYSSSTLEQAAVSAESLRLTVQRPSNEQPLELEVPLSGTPATIGISWRDNPAEPQAVTIVRVLPHSAANLADLRVGDRIHRIDGQPFESPAEFYTRARQLKLPATVLIEREGQVFEKVLGRDTSTPEST